MAATASRWGSTRSSPSAIGYDPDLKPFAYEPVLAKKLLAEAGYPDGFETEFRTTVAQKTLGEALQKYFADVGVKLKVTIMDSAPLTAELFAHNRREATTPASLKTCQLSFFVSRPDMSSLVNVYAFSQPRGTYSPINDPDVDRFLQAQEREMDPVKRYELMREANRVLHNNARFLFLIQSERVFVARDRVLEWQRIKADAYPRHFEGVVVRP